LGIFSVFSIQVFKVLDNKNAAASFATELKRLKKVETTQS
jgi:hypothetical protein